MAFLTTAMPAHTVQFPDITLEEWRAALRKKKTCAAVGPDGVSREDMLRTPDSTLAVVLQWIQSIGQGQAWPSQAGHWPGDSTCICKNAYL